MQNGEYADAFKDLTVDQSKFCPSLLTIQKRMLGSVAEQSNQFAIAEAEAGLCQYHLGHYETAASYLRRALPILEKGYNFEPGNLLPYWFAMASIQEHEGDWQKAADVYQRIMDDLKARGMEEQYKFDCFTAECMKADLIRQYADTDEQAKMVAATHDKLVSARIRNKLEPSEHQRAQRKAQRREYLQEAQNFETAEKYYKEAIKEFTGLYDAEMDSTTSGASLLRKTQYLTAISLANWGMAQLYKKYGFDAQAHEMLDSATKTAHTLEEINFNARHSDPQATQVLAFILRDQASFSSREQFVQAYNYRREAAHVWASLGRVP